MKRIDITRSNIDDYIRETNSRSHLKSELEEKYTKKHEQERKDKLAHLTQRK